MGWVVNQPCTVAAMQTGLRPSRTSCAGLIIPGSCRWLAEYSWAGLLKSAHDANVARRSVRRAPAARGGDIYLSVCFSTLPKRTMLSILWSLSKARMS